MVGLAWTYHGVVAAPRVHAIRANCSACGSSGASARSAWIDARSTVGEPLAVYSSALASGARMLAGSVAIPARADAQLPVSIASNTPRQSLGTTTVGAGGAV